MMMAISLNIGFVASITETGRFLVLLLFQVISLADNMIGGVRVAAVFHSLTKQKQSKYGMWTFSKSEVTIKV